MITNNARASYGRVEVVRYPHTQEVDWNDIVVDQLIIDIAR